MSPACMPAPAMKGLLSAEHPYIFIFGVFACLNHFGPQRNDGEGVSGWVALRAYFDLCFAGQVAVLLFKSG